MAVVAWQLGRAAIVDWRTLIILIASAAVVLRLRVNSALGDCRGWDDWLASALILVCCG